MKLFLVLADGQMVKCFSTRKQACEYVAAAEVQGHLPYKYEFGDADMTASWAQIVNLRDWIFED